MSRVYMDHHAATPVDARVSAAMSTATAAAWGNASSVHAEGRASRALLERAREAIARAVGAQPADLVLTAGGTEACNLAVFGSLEGTPNAHAVTTRIEHPAVLSPLRVLESTARLRLAWLEVPEGRAPDVDAVTAQLGSNTKLAALQWVNHETGTILPVEQYAAACRRAGVLCFVDATQALGKLPVDVTRLGADLVAFASHKVGGPSGAGALWVRRGVELGSRAYGGGQERGRRAGTLDVVSQVGFGVACQLLSERLAAQPRIAALRDRLATALVERGAVANAPAGARVATAANLCFPGWRADMLVAALDLEGVAVSAGSACSSGKSEPSAVLRAMHGREPSRWESSLRFSFGPETSEIDLKFALDVCAKVAARASRSG